ncbi:hypothetical protein QZH41_011416 [Actinostola sp. cb2023]|nr:hypothetical protein QZH41_011416 [Actinostola sp. cb2023]
MGRGQGYNLEKNKLKVAIRKHLLKTYDVIIGPVKYGRGDNQKVEFRLAVTNLVEVRWIDEFLAWDSKNFSSMKYTVFSRNEIWVPDIALLNNADRSEKLAGGPTKFITNVNAKYDGRMTWLSPATFTSTCQQNVKTWPMDTQVCNLTFGSCIYPEKNLLIVPNNKTYKRGKDRLPVICLYNDLENITISYRFLSLHPGSVSNGEWTIDDIEAFPGKTDHNKCCGTKYSTITYKITLTRKPGYIMFYLSPPAVILALLSVMSFFIPTESGERIGFITTILLALMVFLLMIPEYLPRTSDQLPILGILLIFAMVIISTVLVCTIFILLCYYTEGSPSTMMQTLFFPIKSRSKKKRQGKKLKGEVNKAMEMKETDTTKKTSDEEAMVTTNEDEITWQQISTKLNWIFFWLICVISVSVIVSVILYR